MKRSSTQSNSNDIEKLEKLLKKASVPTLPVVAQKLIELCNNENATFAHFGQVLEADPGLASRILKVANSAYYSLRNKVTTLERAIGVLGLKYVKTTALGFHLVTALNQFKADGFDLGTFWHHNLLRGVLARQLAKKYCPDRCDEAFLIGLLQDCGTPFLVEALGIAYAEIWTESRGSQLSLFKLEQEVFEFDHVMAAKVLTDQWGLPEILSQPIHSHHHRPPSEPSQVQLTQLCQISYFVGALSLNNPQSLIEEDLTLPDYCQRVFNINSNGMSTLLQDAKQEYYRISQVYSNILSGNEDVTELIVQAHSLLSDLSEDISREAFTLEEEVKRLKARCSTLTSSVDEYEKQAESDDLTGLALRSPLERYLDNACWKVSNDETSLAVIFIDLDNFKDINDYHSHAAGDRALIEVANLLKNLFGESGCICRYGGDEFVVALMGLKARQAVKLAKGLIKKVHQIKMPVRANSLESQIEFSCSAGMLFCEPGSQPGKSSRILELADHQMYEVKKHGKDNMRFQIVPSKNSPLSTADNSELKQYKGDDHPLQTNILQSDE
ncbi:MAG: GGDEF domain-containing protein [Sedimentisphaerales bacterium]|nr:GGDEF domain-containing protein [Sedimentisphaerales bacterium]